MLLQVDKGGSSNEIHTLGIANGFVTQLETSNSLQNILEFSLANLVFLEKLKFRECSVDVFVNFFYFVCWPLNLVLVRVYKVVVF